MRQVSIGAQALEYIQIISWILSDLLSHYRWRSLYLAFVGGLQILTRYGAMGVLFGFLDHFEKQKQSVVLGVTLPEPRSPEFLVMSATAGGILLMLAACFRFELLQRSVRIGKAYETFCLRRLFSLASRLPNHKAPLASKILAHGCIHKYPMYTRQAAQIAWRLAQIIPSIMGLIVATGILIWLEPMLSAGLASLAIAVVAAQYPANRKAVKASQAIEDYAPHANKRFQDVFRFIQTSPIPLEPEAAEHKSLFQEDNVRNFVKGHTDQVKSIYHAGFISEAGGVLVFIVAIIALGLGVISGNYTYAKALVFIGVIRFMLKDFVKVSKGFTIINRFYTQLKLYREFVLDAMNVVPTQHSGLRPGSCGHTFFTMKCPHLDALDDEKFLRIQPGGRIALLMPVSHSLGSLSFQVSQLILGDQSTPKYAPFTVTSSFLIPDESLRFNLGLTANCRVEEVADTLESLCCPRAAKLVRQYGLDKKGSARRAQKMLSEADLISMNAIAAKMRGHCVFIIDSKTLLSQPKSWADAFLDFFRDDITIILHRHIESLLSFAEPVILIHDGHSFIAWLNSPKDDEERSRLRQIYRNIKQSHSAQVSHGIQTSEILDE